MTGSRRTETRTISGLEVTTVQLPALRGSRLRFRILKLLAPASKALAGLSGLRGKSMEEIGKMDTSALFPALSEIIMQLDDKTQDQLMLEMLACTSVETTDAAGKRIRYDTTTLPMIDLAFGGDVDALWKSIAFALEVNLGGFFDVIGLVAGIPSAPSG